MRADCDECRRLQEEYRIAAMAHFWLEGRLRIAALERDYAALEAALPQEAAERERRNAACIAVREHEAAAHAHLLAQPPALVVNDAPAPDRF